MNNILDSAKKFSRLFDVEYEIILAKKGNQVRLVISFEKFHFYHLAGLQYLTDIHELDNQREIVFDWILSESIKNERIESSQFYPKIKERVHYLAQLESIFDSNDTVFKYDEKENILTSQITGEYLMKNIVESRNIFTFLDKTKDDKYYCRSFFPQSFKDYSYRQKRWTVLSKKKIFKKFGEAIVLYDYFAEKSPR
ncbi:PBECR4 domain-containing protein [Treponema sp.]|uniref:PBECR4 domain-containing protein n=1 Tax=Treponema sp. TaxID=166 RepID=UPI0025DA1F6D|nr:PBECR4 domain-containing protein [Treponema sp.]MBR4322291.1 hypothetical protein [Treponema sp.]